MLVKLLKADLLPTVWIPPESQRHVRELLTYRARLVRQRTAVINEVRAVYAKKDIDPQAQAWAGTPQCLGS
jgi:transposase